MKVAIIGAGLAGLSCAFALESYGIRPVVYEINSCIGEQHPHVSAILEIIHRPIRDSVKYFKKNLGLEIMPLNTLNKIAHYSPNRRTVIEGNFGYLFVRDKNNPELDVKCQIYSQLKNTEIRYNHVGDYRNLEKEYDFVVVAHGDSNYAEELGCWQEWLKTYVRGAIVEGSFDPNELIVWINKDYCKNGYAYLTPFSKNRASVAMVVTNVNEKEIDPYWDLFMYTEKLQYKIIQEFKLEHKSGHVYPHRLGKVLFAGNAGGVIDPFLGFGQMSSMMMGIAAARFIAVGKDYEKEISFITKNNIRLRKFRQAFDQSSNLTYDVLMTALGLPGIKHVLYHTPLNVVKLGAFLMKFSPKKD